ncbi:ATP-binding protein [Streptomyces sp. NRRL S-646]|uniref:ATP-binding protein n=1 Tax=Streptomyces sp. NRRL S-646 TaxID=1463917 RepID=UPI00099C7889|nr:ATP-binding protein [Streptomyces sp. NRRL S-646]
MDQKAASNETAAHNEQIKIDVADFVESSNQRSGSVAVRISLGIIQRFSEGLYSSPNKAFEELVSNSYDAGASQVWVYMPSDLEPEDSTLIVVDDGESMDLDGLQQLWEVGQSRKRQQGHVRGRAPIGKFGIGKLATYVLAEELTYIVCRSGQYLAVTMDYRQVQGEMDDPQSLQLLVAELTREEAEQSLRSALSNMYMGSNSLVLNKLFTNEGAPRSWTAAIMTSLKERARHIQLGRLRWILSTALPLNPGFQLWLNDGPIDPSKAAGKTHWTFTVGKSEDELRDGKSKVEGTACSIETPSGAIPAFRLPLAGNVWGSARLFVESLQKGKSTFLARSHGFFVRVRGRLINLDESSFNVGPELHHGTLTRFHMEINADDLDRLVASPRESLQDSPELRELRKYMLAVFNKARKVLLQADSQDQMPYLTKQGRISDPAPVLTQAPLRRALDKVVAGDEAARESMGLSRRAVAQTSDVLASEEDVLEQVLIEPYGQDAQLVRYDPERKAAVLNEEHPFISNYINEKGLREPLKLLALTELLTQAYMLDENIPSEVVARVMGKRDAFLRDLVKRHPRSAFVVARQLLDASNQEKELEDAVADALTLLGFSVQRIGGNGSVDGIAIAQLGRRNGDENESYALTYDAKSSGREARKILDSSAVAIQDELFPTQREKTPRIQAGTARTSILRVHRERAKEKHGLKIDPKYTLLVAPGFQGDGIDESLIEAICRNDGITPITVEDLAHLVELFPIRGVSPLTLKELFECRSPAESRQFVERLEKAEPPHAPPIEEIVTLLVQYALRRNPITIKDLITGLFERSNFEYEPHEDELAAVIRGLAALAPNSIYYDGTFVALNSTPDALYREWGSSLDSYPSRVSESYRMSVPSSLRKVIQEGF